MTDEELAVEYRKNLKQKLTDDDDFERLGMFDENVEQAFLAGLRAGRLEWHDLRKDPNDLPDGHRSVWTNVGSGYHDSDGWWDGFGRLRGVTAWCEPKFEEV